MRLYLSDLHLDDPRSRAFRSFERLLEVESRRADAIYLLGDVTEVWVGDDDDSDLAAALRRLFKVTATHCRVAFMHGNRDFLVGKRFAAATGIELIDDPCLLPDGTLLAHGDAFCTDDAEYQALRAHLRAPETRQQLLAAPLASRRALASQARAQSQAVNANKPSNIMDVNPAEVDRVATLHNARRLIHGHTHRPGRHSHDWGHRYVLGAWEQCGWLVRQTAAGVEPRLECFPLG